MTPPSAGSPAPRGDSPRGGGTNGSAPSAPRQGAAVGTPYAEKSTFRRGEVILDRFKILRFIAKGGAGEVYEAQDLELRCPVALKVARPELSENEHATERFRREIALARQVTHPNVCRIFDVFRCNVPPAEPGAPTRETLFLTMELLNGESLAARIHRLGAFSPEDALPLIEGMVAGLEAAHRVGVIHRDFKSANVVLVEEEAGTRAVITDFGLARGLLPDDLEQDITMTGTVVGTPNYMAPEQLTGGEITPQVDMYAMGIVIYEMMTGTRPFSGETDLSTAVKRLTEAPTSPRLHVPDLDPAWERAILRCLERDPDDRFDDFRELIRALHGEAPVQKPPSARRRQRRHVGWVAAVAAPVVLASALFFFSFDDVLVLPGGLTTVRTPSVAVLDFRNLGDRRSQVSPASMAWVFQADLEEGQGFRPLARDRVVSTSSELGIFNDGELTKEKLDRLFEELQTDLIAEGAYLELEDGQLHLQVRLHDRAGGVTTVTEVGSANDHFELLNEATRRLRAIAGFEATSSEDSPSDAVDGGEPTPAERDDS